MTIKWQIPNGLVPVGTGDKVEGREYDGEDHFDILSNETQNVLIVPQRQRLLRNL